MKQEKLELNKLELAILKCIAEQSSSRLPPLHSLRVSSREYTGVGSFTKFDYEASLQDNKTRSASLKAQIRIPNVSGGLGAVLFLNGNEPDILEIYTYGNDSWDGDFSDFSIDLDI